MLRFIYICIIAILLSMSSPSPIINSIQPRLESTSNTGDVLELEAPSPYVKGIAATRALLERVQGYRMPVASLHIESSSSRIAITDFFSDSHVYSRGTVKPSTQEIDQVTLLSRLQLSSVTKNIQRRAAEVNSTCADDNSATIVRIIRTPWPIVAGQAIISYIIALRGSMAWHSTDLTSNPSLFKQVMWAIGLIRAAGALVYLVMDIAESNGIIPAVGTSITLGTLLRGSYEFNAGVGARILSYLGISIASLGLLLYTINGTLGWVLHNDANVSAILVSGNQVFYYWTMGDWLARTSWIAGAVFFSFLAISPILISSGCIRFNWTDNGDPRRRSFRLIRTAINYVIVAGGIAACVAAGMDAADSEIDGENLICDTLTLPTSASGFWDVWTRDKVAVVRSLFTW